MAKIKNLLISFSGGRSSGMMTKHILESQKYKDYNKLFVFANTGKERPETLKFVNECDQNWSLNLVWVEAVVTLKKGAGIQAITTNYKNASRKGEPFSAVIEKSSMGDFKSVPFQKAPYCSDRLKTIPINKFAKEYFNEENYLSAIGMRYEDMPRRICKAELKATDKERNYKIYPLLTDFEKYITQKDVIEFWKTQKFDLEINSKFGNCDLCWKKSEKNIIETLREKPQLADWWTKEEKKYNTAFFRGNQYAKDLLAKSKLNTTLDLFSDKGDSCFCG